MAKTLLKDDFRKTLLTAMFYEGKLSLSELSHRCHKSIPNVTNVVAELQKEGYIEVHEPTESSGGRRPVKYSLNKDKDHYFVAVATDQLMTRIAFYDLKRKLVGEVQTENINNYEDPDGLNRLIAFINQAIDQSKISRNKIQAVGVAMPGFVNIVEGVNYSFFTDIDQSLRDHLTDKIGLPVFIDNDSSAIAYAELRFGAAKDLKNVMVVNIGWGTGLGMIVNGSLFRGHSGYAGELSHIPLSDNDNLCSCGKRGCLEVDTSLVVVADKAKEAIRLGAKSSLSTLFSHPSKLPGEHLIDAAVKGDPLAISLLSEASFMLGKGLATLIHIMNPELIVLSGRGAEAGNIMVAPIRQALHQFCIPKLMEHTELVVSELGNNAELIGALAIAIENHEFY